MEVRVSRTPRVASVISGLGGGKGGRVRGLVEAVGALEGGFGEEQG